jgi:tRNA nucleotidyltransferase (CCA-adding enzyme)
MPLGTSRAIRTAAVLWRERDGWSPSASASQVVSAFDEAPEESLLGVWLALGSGDPLRGNIERYLASYRFIQPTVTGQDLIALGLPPGPTYGRLLAALRQAWLDGTVTDAEAERKLLDTLLDRVSG